MRYIVSLFIAIVLVIGLTTAIAGEQQPWVRLSYDSSPDMPDHLAYRDYLNYVQSALTKGESKALDFVVFTLRIPETETQMASAQAALAVFAKSITALRRNTLASELENTCKSAEDANRTDDDFYRAMDIQDDLNDAIARQVYLEARQQLDQETVALFDDEIDRHKLTMSLTRLDHKAYWETNYPELDVADQVIENCAQLAHQFEVEFGNGDG